MRIIVDGTRGRGSWCVRRTAAGRGGTFSTSPALLLRDEDLSSASARLRTRVAVGLVVAAAAFGAGSLAHAIPQPESSPADTSRTRVDGGTGIEGDRVVVFSNRPLPPGGTAAPRILEVSFSIGNGPVGWYPPRRMIAVSVQFDQPVTVDTAGGTPLIDVVLGAGEFRSARYASGSGSEELVFHYATGDWNRNFSAATVVANTLNPNGGRIDGSETHTAANLAHAAGRLDNVGARPKSGTTTAAAMAAAPTLVALPPAAVRTPLPNLPPAAEPAQATGGRGFVDGVSGSPQPALATSALATGPDQSGVDPGSALAEVRQFRVTPAQDDTGPATSNSLRAASSGTPPAPYLWAWVDGQTRITLSWSGGHRVTPEITNHQIQVCEQLDADDCTANDWQILVDEHEQTTPWRSNRYIHTGLPPGSTRHYRVASRNANGLGEFSSVRGATTESMPAHADCMGAVWKAYVTVATFGAHDYQGFRGDQLEGALTEDMAGTIPDDGFSLGATTYQINQIYYSHEQTTPTVIGSYYFPASYHLALSHYPAPDDKIKDLTLYVGEIALPLSQAGYSHQGFGEAFRWGDASDQVAAFPSDYDDPYDGTFDYRDGDSVMVCITDAAPNVTLVLSPATIAEAGGVSTVTATLAQGVEDAFEVDVSTEIESPVTEDDFTLSANTILSFAANATASSGTVTITAQDNDVDAQDKTISVRGAVSAGARPRSPQPVTLTIEDDDDAPVLSLGGRSGRDRRGRRHFGRSRQHRRHHVCRGPDDHPHVRRQRGEGHRLRRIGRSSSRLRRVSTR